MATQRLPSGSLLAESTAGWQRLPDGSLAYDATAAAVDGTASGAPLAGTGSLSSGAAPGAAVSSGATLTGTGSIAAGAASAGGSATVAGATLTGTGTLAAGAASGGGATFTTSAIHNNTGTVQAAVNLVWEWHAGSVPGGVPDSVTYGSSTTSGAGIAVLAGIPAGAGFLLAVTDDGAVYYESGTAA